MAGHVAYCVPVLSSELTGIDAHLVVVVGVRRIFNRSHINGGILYLFCLYLKFTIQELYSCAWFQKENILIYMYLSIRDLFCCI